MDDPFYPEEKPKRRINATNSSSSFLLFGVIAFMLLGAGLFILSASPSQPIERIALSTEVFHQEASPTPTIRLPSIESDRGVLAFSSNRQNKWQLYLIDADGEQIVALDDLPLLDLAYPAWSSDGRQLAFQTANRRLGVIDADGMREYGSGSVIAPSWSPDGTRIVYTAFQSGVGWDLYVITLATESIQRLTFHASNDAYPSWSADGLTIAFNSMRDGNDQIYLIDADGENLRRITENSDSDRYPVWSPDSTQIAFSSDRGGNGYDLWVMNADGSDPRVLVESMGDNIMNAWSPDGTQIAFSTDRDGNWEIYLLTIASGELRRLTNNDAADQFAVWRR